MKSSKIIIWKFTNGRGLNEKEFKEYFEKKIFKTIRKFEMLKGLKNKEVLVSSSKDINTIILNTIIQKRFSTKSSKTPTFSSDNLTDVSERIFLEILKGKFSKRKENENCPLLYHSDKEIELYGKLSGLSGVIKKRNKKVQNFFRKFMNKNPDLEHNILNAHKQLG